MVSKFKLILMSFLDYAHGAALKEALDMEKTSKEAMGKGALILSVCLIVDLAHAWTTPEALANSASAELTSYNNGWSVAANSAGVHAVYCIASNQIVYRKRTGSTWGSPVILYTGPCGEPVITASNTAVHVAWRGPADYFGYKILYARSVDGGTTWEPYVQVDGSGKAFNCPISMAAADNGDTVYITYAGLAQVETPQTMAIWCARGIYIPGSGWVWSENPVEEQNYDPYATWSAPSVGYKATATGGTLCVAWETWGQTGYIKAGLSDANGASWTVYELSTDDPGVCHDPSVAVTQDTVAVAYWVETQLGGYVVWRAKFLSNPWRPKITLASGGKTPNILLSGAILYAVYRNTTANGDILYTAAHVSGAQPPFPPLNISNTPAYDDKHPSICKGGNGVFHVVFSELRKTTSWDVFYTNSGSREGAGPVGSLSGARPALEITQSAPGFLLNMDKGAEVSVSIYDPAGRIVQELFRGTLEAGEHAFSWPTLNQGIYFATVQVGDRRTNLKFVAQ